MNKKFMWLIVLLLASKALVAQNIVINEGSGAFNIQGINNHDGDSITIFYHKPLNYSTNSKILVVVPGAGRNADAYRDSWVPTSEEYSVLILSPSYPEKEYNYGDYHLGGIVKDLNLSKGVSFKKGTNQVIIDEDAVEFNVNNKKEEWIFKDFDRIFGLAKKATKSNQKAYDLFGHSAGGQILHRLALFNPASNADRIIASNGGTYTLPDYKEDFPFGMKNTIISPKELKKSFKKNLVLLLGELDNDSETRGTMLRSITADKQGINRLDRGRYFYTTCKDLSKALNLKFNWKMEVVPNTGHDQKKMAEAAAKYLYGQN